MKLIVGLGNPGKEYENTRHNAGFLTIDLIESKLADAAGWSLKKDFHALIAEGHVEKERIVLIKPQTYMNLSGDAVQAVASYYKVPLTDILVIHDELDLPPGQMAFLAKGGHAGHNGIASIQERLGTEAVQRLRIGIGRPAPPQAAETWVLGGMEIATADACPLAADAALEWATVGIDKAMNTWNRK